MISENLDHHPSDRIEPTSRLLNIGCGRRYHSGWTNLDLESRDASVVQWDITSGLPFEDNTLDVVYHSHVLEHLRPDDGEHLLQECYRVLAPGGVLRVVVPDLEKIVQLYLATHQEAWLGDEKAAVDYNWMKLELLDQLVRTSSGGRMGPYMASEKIRNSEFVRSRVGDEFSICRESVEIDQVRKPTLSERAQERTLSWRVRMARRCVRWLLGRVEEKSFQEGLFREKGEIHRWMYDRFSLRELCSDLGFEDFEVCTAFDSRVDRYTDYQLDAAGEVVRKPDSLFVECAKPVAVTREIDRPQLADVA